ncbi:MAG: response regulator [Bacteroidia bacterium]
MTTVPHNNSIPISVLLADDDRDDCFFFKNALSKLSIPTQFTTVSDGEKLMKYLLENSSALPAVLFLDFNMPRKNGAECLREIKHNRNFKSLPVIMYSTALHDAIADDLYDEGAHYFVRKEGLTELTNVLLRVLTMITENKFERPARDKFVLSLEAI